MTPRCCKLLSRGALARALRALAGRFPFRRGAPSCFPVLSRTPDASWGSFEGLWGSILASGVPPGSLLGASWAPSWGPRASKSAPKAPRKPTKSGQERPKSAPRGPKQPQATRFWASWGLPRPRREPGSKKKHPKSRKNTKSIVKHVVLFKKSVFSLGLAAFLTLKTQPNRAKTLFSVPKPRILHGPGVYFSRFF